MNARRVYVDYLEDILNAIEKSQEFTAGMNYEQFRQDDKSIFAVVRALEIVGEATKQLPQELRDQHAQIPWREVAGMRDKLIHRYFGVDPLVVWKTVTEDLPTLQLVVEQILQDAQTQE